MTPTQREWFIRGVQSRNTKITVGRGAQTFALALWGFGATYLAATLIPRYPTMSLAIILFLIMPLIFFSLMLSMGRAGQWLLAVLCASGMIITGTVFYGHVFPDPPIARGAASDDARFFVSVSSMDLGSSEPSWEDYRLVDDEAQLHVAVTVVNLSTAQRLDDATLTLRVEPRSGGMVRIDAVVDAPGFYSASAEALVQARDPRQAALEFSIGEYISIGISQAPDSGESDPEINTYESSQVLDPNYANSNLPSIPASQGATNGNRVWTIVPAVFRYLDD